MSEITEIKTLNGYPLADTKARADISTLSEEIANKKGLTSAQITALDNMFKVCAYTSSANSAYAAFCAAFGITGGGTGGDSGEGSDGVNVYFADYSEWPKWGSGISTIENGFSVNSQELSYSAGIIVGIVQPVKYGDLKNKTLKFSCDINGEMESGGYWPFYLRTYTGIPESGFTDKAGAFIRGNSQTVTGHYEWTVTPAEATWEGGTPSDTSYLGFQTYAYFVGTATITNFRVEVV